MKVLGIDPSITATGIAGYHSTNVEPYELMLVGRAGVTKMDPWDRLDTMTGLVLDIAAYCGHGIDLVAIEAPYASHGKAAAAGLPGERTWLFYEILTQVGLFWPTVVVPNAALKRYATGKGNANKAAMLEALVRRAPEWVTKGNDNLVDAAWLAMLAADMLCLPLVDLPALNRAALTNLTIHK